jgi:hypothetical protein
VLGQGLDQSVSLLALQKAHAPAGYFQHANLRLPRSPAAPRAHESHQSPATRKHAFGMSNFDTVLDDCR